MISVNGTLFGTTAWGGNRATNLGDGTVFSISANGSETVLHRFTGTDGANPNAGLIDVNGTLYGTTTSGGTNNDGTVFSISASGTEKVLHSFGGSDGIRPKRLDRREGHALRDHDRRRRVHLLHKSPDQLWNCLQHEYVRRGESVAQFR